MDELPLLLGASQLRTIWLVPTVVDKLVGTDETVVNAPAVAVVLSFMLYTVPLALVSSRLKLVPLDI
jgi:hypothetical protein